MKIALILAATCLVSPHVQAQNGASQGTLFFQYASGGNWTQVGEEPTGRGLASKILRSSPANGPQMVGVKCYGVTFDPNTNQMCFVRSLKIKNGATEKTGSVFYLGNLDGSNIRLLSRERLDYSGFSPLPNDFTPFYTPDGHILFETENRIARMNGDGGNVVFLTGTGEKCGTPRQVGERIVFEKEGVCLMNANGAARARIASFSTHDGSSPRSDMYADPQLSPDGARVVFTRDGQIFVSDLDHPKTARQVSDRDARFQVESYSDPVWSPDGKFLAVGGGTMDSHDIFLIEVASGKMTRLTDTPARDELPNDWDLTRP